MSCRAKTTYSSRSFCRRSTTLTVHEPHHRTLQTVLRDKPANTFSSATSTHNVNPLTAVDCTAGAAAGAVDVSPNLGLSHLARYGFSVPQLARRCANATSTAADVCADDFGCGPETLERSTLPTGTAPPRSMPARSASVGTVLVSPSASAMRADSARPAAFSASAPLGRARRAERDREARAARSSTRVDRAALASRHVLFLLLEGGGR